MMCDYDVVNVLSKFFVTLLMMFVNNACATFGTSFLYNFLLHSCTSHPSLILLHPDDFLVLRKSRNLWPVGSLTKYNFR